MVLVRSVRIESCTAAGSELLELRQEVLYPIHHRDDVWRRLALDIDDDRRDLIHPRPRLAAFSTSSMTLANRKYALARRCGRR
jgi:hypothetical protein